ncbi:2Fe-2S iron-sulfur cluster-binding protein [Actinomadura sediminis]|uniref:2Fe-2S iron-sulfur cluster-binding protein n=1 Tax=Actinomadura sediminis TaxID=1038904 RepID=A0ABW3EM93_9ACTN
MRARRFTVEPGASILETLRAGGVDLPSSCEEGICGTCETRVLAGEPEHRDHVLTDDERAAGATMMLCVSRSRTPELVLDL